MKFLILLCLSILFLSCSNEQIINTVLLPIDDATIGVKSKIVYPSLESNQMGSIEDFEYDNENNLLKKLYYGGDREKLGHYELFYYESNGSLIYKLNYHSNLNSPSGFILLDSTNYLYSGNFLTSEIITYPLAKYYDEYKYEYEGKYLIKKSKYHNGNIESSISFEYKNGKLYGEKSNEGIVSKEYKYIDNRLVEIIFYLPINEIKRKINYTYNGKGKLILEEVNELSIYSSTLSHIVKYIY